MEIAFAKCPRYGPPADDLQHRLGYSIFLAASLDLRFTPAAHAAKPTSLWLRTPARKPWPQTLDPDALGNGAGGCTGILNNVVQLLHLTFLPRAVSGTTKMLRHFKFGHMIRKVFTGPMV